MSAIEGRLNRQPYLYWRLGLAPISYIAFNAEAMMGIILLLVAAAGVVLAIGRLHDLGKSGWWGAIMFVPVVSSIFGIYLLFAKGTDGPNEYGPDPLREDGEVLSASDLIKKTKGGVWRDFGKDESDVVGVIKLFISKKMDNESILLELKEFLDMGDMSFSARKEEILLEIEAVREKNI